MFCLLFSSLSVARLVFFAFGQRLDCCVTYVQLLVKKKKEQTFLSHQQGDDGWCQPDQNVAGGLFQHGSSDSDGRFQQNPDGDRALGQQNKIVMGICVFVEHSGEILSTHEGLEEEEGRRRRE